MGDSQGSDFITQSQDKYYCSSVVELTYMDVVCYGSLVSNTKSSFATIQQEIKKPTFPGYFSNVLRNCSLCISQSLDLVSHLIIETDINIDQLKEYINDAVCILQLLSDLTKSIIESISMLCCSMKQFPTVTAHIIKTVFGHCRDSQSMYGRNLNSVEKQIKDLFRTCHELQLTYLMVLEKHYIFDLTQKDEQDILLEALDINLKIGDIVQSLDVKTMAEQWKAYTVICERYSDTLMDKQVCKHCVTILCDMTIKNIRIALEENQEKIIVRSLKVSNFTLKILLKICVIFKHSTVKDYDSIMELMLYVNLNNEAYLHTMGGKSSQLITLYNNNVNNAINSLLSELLCDEKFLHVRIIFEQCGGIKYNESSCFLLLDIVMVPFATWSFGCNVAKFLWDQKKSILNYKIDSIRRDDKVLGFINLVISMIRLILQKSDDQLQKLEKHEIVSVIYSFLPICHVWFNMGLKYNCDTSSQHYHSYGLYEHLLVHTVSLISTMTCDELNIVERMMLEALLSADCISAIFTSNLWTILARMLSRELLLTQVVSLSNIYQKLETYNICIDCPQTVHLSHTISRLFEVMVIDDKVKIYSMFSISDEKNLGLWRCFKIINLPNDMQYNAEDFIVKKFQTLIQQLASDIYVDIDIVIKSMHLVSTCSLKQHDELDFSLVTAWTKACPKNFTHIVKKIDKGTLWYYKYIEALITLTEAVAYILHRNSITMMKVLHIISTITYVGCRELRLLLINILCKLANIEANGANKHVSDTILTQTFSELIANKDSVVRNKLFNVASKYKTDNLYRILANVVNVDESLAEMWTCFIKYGRLQEKDINPKVQLQAALDFEYSHKCLECDDLRDQSLGLQKCLRNNFDIDVEMLFESDEEPACKKTKRDANNVDEIISKMEMDASLICNLKENILTSDNKKRIKDICKKLSNIID